MLDKRRCSRTPALLGFLILYRRTGTGVRVVHRYDQPAITDPTQLGRLSRDTITPDWSFEKDFPGVINPTTSYHYETISVFVPNWFPFLQISIDSNNANIFASAYDTSYNPNPIAANRGLDVNYLGDRGRQRKLLRYSPRFFQVVDQTAANSPSGGTLIVVLNETTTNWRRTQFTGRCCGGRFLRYRF